MKGLLELKMELGDAHRQASHWNAEVSNLEREIRDIESRNFIKANGITEENVFWTSENPEWFGMVQELVNHLAEAHDTLHDWAEWNGELHRVSDLLANKWTRPTCRAEHVKRKATA